MAGGDNSRDDKASEVEKQAGMERWERSRRDDLADAIGVIVIPPYHGADASGRIKFGLPPLGGFWDDSVVNRYVGEVEKTIQSVIQEEADVDSELRTRSAEIAAAPYSVGPAAQEWPKYLFLLYEHGQYILDDALRLYGAAQMVQSVVKRLRKHDDQVADDKDRSVDQYEAKQVAGAGNGPIHAEVWLTPGALVSLCVMDAHDRYDIRDDIDVEIHTRSWSDYSTQGHPGLGNDIHMVRVRGEGKSLYWVVQTSGAVVEHFSLEDQVLAQLPLPTWFEDEPWRTSSFRTDHQHIQLKFDFDAKEH